MYVTIMPALSFPVPPIDGLLKSYYQGRGVTIENEIPKEVIIKHDTIPVLDLDDEAALKALGSVKKAPPKKAPL